MSSDGGEPVVRLEDVHVIYDGTCVLDVDALSIFPGERVFLLGRSGSGKTTLMRVLKGRIRPATGRGLVMGSNPLEGNDRRRRAHQRRVAMIDQEFYLVPRMRVIENILTGSLGRVPRWRSLLGWYPAREWAEAERILREVGLEGLGNRRVETLSGGQRQRAAIGRALMQDAEVILADEPISNLDPELAEDALDLLVACVERRNVTLIVTLHQPSLARRFATRLIGLSRGEVIYDGPPDGLTEEALAKVYGATAGEDDFGLKRGNDDGSSTAVAAAADAPHLRILGR